MGGGAGRGKFKGKPTGRRHFSTPEEMGTFSRPWAVFSSLCVPPSPLAVPSCRLFTPNSAVFCTDGDILLIVIGSTAAGTSTKPKSFKRVSGFPSFFPSHFWLGLYGISGLWEMELLSRSAFEVQPGTSSPVLVQ